MNRGGILIGALAAAALAVAVQAQEPPKTLRDGVFTSEQALRGKSGFDGVCARCHGIPLTGSQGNGPPLKGPAFLAHWDKDTLGGLYTKIGSTLNDAGRYRQVKLQISMSSSRTAFPRASPTFPAT
jgi:hypothetical protein